VHGAAAHHDVDIGPQGQSHLGEMREQALADRPVVGGGLGRRRLGDGEPAQEVRPADDADSGSPRITSTRLIRRRSSRPRPRRVVRPPRP
jgi:hypothetical protein